MRTILTVSPDEELDAPDSPDGESYQHALLYGDSQAAFADRLSELIDLILPGYGDLAETPEGDDEALIQRHRHLVEVANSVQADYNHQAVDRGLLDPATTDENLLTATAHDRAQSWSGLHSEGSDRPGFNWDLAFPLVLIATDYAPYVADRPTPTGTVVLLDPYDETTYLESLNRLGFVTYMRRS